eukprot:6065845-Heterocapsa_arctica.AAC.1
MRQFLNQALTDRASPTSLPPSPAQCPPCRSLLARSAGYGSSIDANFRRTSATGTSSSSWPCGSSSCPFPASHPTSTSTALGTT